MMGEEFEINTMEDPREDMNDKQLNEEEGKVKIIPSSEFPELGTDNPVERIMPLYIGYGKKTKR